MLGATNLLKCHKVNTEELRKLAEEEILLHKGQINLMDHVDGTVQFIISLNHKNDHFLLKLKRMKTVKTFR